VEGVGEEGVLDVGGEELLMLLFVLEAEGEAAGGFFVQGLGEELLDRGVYVGAIGEDVCEGWAGEAGAEFLLGHVAEGVVVGVEGAGFGAGLDHHVFWR
jgi:hypothetical protein